MKKSFFIIIFFVWMILLFTSTHIVHSQSGWNIIQSQADYSLYSVSFTNQYNGWAAGELYHICQGYGLIIATTNGGLDWFSQYTDTSYYYFSSVYFINQFTGWTVGCPGGILKTTNGGLNWFNQTDWIQLYLPQIFFVNQNTGWCIGDTVNGGGVILKTTNAGINWFYQNIDYPYRLIYEYFIDNYTGWIIGYSNRSVILKTTNSGNNWSVQFNDTIHNYLTVIQFVDPNTGWAINQTEYSYGKILKSTNGGSNWFIQYVSNSSMLYTLFFSNQSTGWVGGSDYYNHNSIILKTTNSGISWNVNFDSCGANKDIFSFSFINDNTGWAIGANGIILKTTTGGEPIGIKPISNEIPKKFQLYQNYPNPFNPSTKIKFSIPKTPLPPFNKGGSVTLKIYDILGREVATLVNDKLQPGTYEVEFDGTNYPSGVYFYGLTAETFSETKKLVLLK